MPNFEDELVPKGPPDLCFESSAFTKESFSVDQFLQDHRTGGNLETMRDDLGVYLKVLRSAMIDLINKDYADYVNLSRNLIGLDKAIGGINTPLGQLKEELMQVIEYIERAVAEISEKLERRKGLRECKRSLRCLSRVRLLLRKLDSLLVSPHVDADAMERAVAEYSQLQFNSERCFHLLSHQEKQSYKETGETLFRKVNDLFLASLQSREKGEEDLRRCLAFYLKMNRHQDAERLYRERVVSLGLERLMTKENLKSQARGLPALYEKVLSYVDTDMKLLLHLTSPHNQCGGLERYDFLVRSFWPEVVEKLEINLTSIYDAGDPDTFHNRYSDTMEFLKELGRRFRSEESVREWQDSQLFSSFISKWNIAVYFQIRFQEMVRRTEKSLERRDVTEVGGWRLSASEGVWQCLQRCWHPSVFLLPIADKLWKLTLQILSRYHTWLRHSISPQAGGSVEKAGGWKYLVLVYWDVDTMVTRVPELQQTAFACIPSLSSTTAQSLSRSLDESRERLKTELVSVESRVVRGLAADCSSALRQVSDIPRLYRRTNRDPPTKPCPYVSSLLDPVIRFSKEHTDLPPASLWLQTVFSDLTKQYYKLVSEVLTSVQKTEESLRRLKRAREGKGGGGGQQQGRAADDDKIRQQLHIDVSAYSSAIDELGIKRSNVEQLNNLLLLVETTQKL